jgi:hypothetical protein
MRNFIWSGDLDTNKFVTVSSKTICTPILEGGIGIRSIKNLNEASSLILCWELHSENHWLFFLEVEF